MLSSPSPDLIQGLWPGDPVNTDCGYWIARSIPGSSPGRAMTLLVKDADDRAGKRLPLACRSGRRQGVCKSALSGRWCAAAAACCDHDRRARMRNLLHIDLDGRI